MYYLYYVLFVHKRDVKKKNVLKLYNDSQSLNKHNFFYKYLNIPTQIQSLQKRKHDFLL